MLAMVLYVLSGLGADQRYYDEIDFGPYEVRFLNWSQPSKGIGLVDYSRQLADEIKEKEHLIVATSFGGLVAQEIATQTNPKGLIMLGTPTSRDQYKMVTKIGLNLAKLLPIGLIRICGRFSGIIGAPKEKRFLYREMLKLTSDQLLRFSLNELHQWTGRSLTCEVSQSIGTNDFFFRQHAGSGGEKLADCGHFSAWENPNLVSRIIQEEILALKT